MREKPIVDLRAGDISQVWQMLAIIDATWAALDDVVPEWLVNDLSVRGRRMGL